MKSFLSGLNFLKSKKAEPVPEDKPPTPSRTPVVGMVAKAPAPSSKPSRNPIKDTLYGNLPMDQWPPADDDATVSPWAEFVAARDHLAAGQKDEAIAIWQAIVLSPGLESLHYVQAWHFLRQNGVQPPEEEAKSIYGVIGEEGRSGVLTAVYVDGQARVYDDQSQSIVWSHPDASLDPLIETAMGGAVALVHKMKQSDPRIDSSRLAISSVSVLTPGGVWTKTGAPGTFEALPLIKPIADGLGLVNKALMEKTGRSPQG